MIKCPLYSQITSHTLDPVPYYIYPALGLLLILNLLNSKPVSYGIPYQKDLEKSRILILLKLNCSII